MNEKIEIAKNYHELTKHSYYSVRTTRYYLDWENKPYPFKVYINLPKYSLPNKIEKPDLQTHLSFEYPNETSNKITLNDIAEILFFSYGITRKLRFSDEIFYFRAAAATGALYPIEIYLVAEGLKDLDNGVYHFDPGEFILSTLRKGNYMYYLYEYTGKNNTLKNSNVAFILTSLAWRNAWKYRERSYRHWFWDAGTVIANMISTLNSKNFNNELILGFVDDRINHLLGIDGIEEASVAIIALNGNRNLEEANLEIPYKNPSYVNVSKKKKIYEEIIKINIASSFQTPEEVVNWLNKCYFGNDSNNIDALRIKLMLYDNIETLKLGDTILRRGSARKFSLEPIRYEELSVILKYSFKPIKADFLPMHDQSLVDAYLIVNSVDGLDNGSYYYDRNKEELVALKKGKFRKIAEYLCLEQELAYQASVIFFLMTRLNEILNQLGNRGYRAAQLEGGIRAGRIYLISYSLGLGATGLTFYDDDITEFFSPHAEDKNNIIVVAVGKPAYKAKSGKIYLNAVDHEEYLKKFNLN